MRVGTGAFGATGGASRAPGSQVGGRRLAHLVERAEAEAWAEIQGAAPPEFRARVGVDVRLPGGGIVAIMARHVDNPGLNRVFAPGIDAPLTAELLDAVVADYRDAGVPRFIVHWSPHAAPVEAPAWFLARGFRPVLRMAKLCRRADPTASAPTDLRVVEIGAAEAEVFGTTVAAANGEPAEVAPGLSATVGHAGWRHYVALDGRRPVAGAALFARGNIAWCGFGATLLGDRRRGAQSALLARRVRDAAAMGCEWVVCETLEDTAERPNASYRNMRRAGFELVHLRETYLMDLAR